MEAKREKKFDPKKEAATTKKSLGQWVQGVVK